MEKIRTGVVGAGFIGSAHVEALRRLGYVEVAAICDRADPEGNAERLHIPRSYSDHREMLEREKLDAIHICTPNATHFEIAKAALDLGVHVLCEKPMTFTVAEAEELTALAEGKGLVNGVNFHCRYYPMVREMRELVRKGGLGRLLSIHGCYLQDWLLLDTDYSWRLEQGQSGASRAVADIGSHWLDAAEFVTGRPIRRVFADLATFHPVRKKPVKAAASFANMRTRAEAYEEFAVDTEDYAQILLDFGDGAKGNLTVSQMFAGRKNQMVIDVAGVDGSLHWDSERLDRLWLGRRTGYNQEIVKDPSLLEEGAAALCGCPGGHAEGFPDAFVQNFGAFYRHISSGVRGDHASFRDGMREMKLCAAIVASAKEGRWVDVGD